MIVCPICATPMEHNDSVTGACDCGFLHYNGSCYFLLPLAPRAGIHPFVCFVQSSAKLEIQYWSRETRGRKSELLDPRSLPEFVQQSIVFRVLSS